MRILNIVGARPNLVKIAPLLREMRRHPEIEPILVHTGQHYDEKLSDVFFRQMGIPEPDVNLEVGSGSHAWQTSEILRKIETVLLERKPDCVLVVGDVNSTVAVSLAAAKLGIPVVHVEAGLRSADWSMPEEVNRVVTDRVSDYLFAPSADAVPLAAWRAGAGVVLVHGSSEILAGDTVIYALPHGGPGIVPA